VADTFIHGCDATQLVDLHLNDSTLNVSALIIGVAQRNVQDATACINIHACEERVHT
jgi:hypothetical protein